MQVAIPAGPVEDRFLDFLAVECCLIRIHVVIPSLEVWDSTRLEALCGLCFESWYSECRLNHMREKIGGVAVVIVVAVFRPTLRQARVSVPINITKLPGVVDTQDPSIPSPTTHTFFMFFFLLQSFGFRRPSPLP